MIPVDLSANCEGWIYAPYGSGIQFLRNPIQGSVFGIHGTCLHGRESLLSTSQLSPGKGDVTVRLSGALPPL